MEDTNLMKLNESFVSNQQAEFPYINFDDYDQNDETGKFIKLEGIQKSVSKLILFIILSVTIIPLFLAKWSLKMRRILLYKSADINNATHIFIQGISIFL